MKVEFNKINNLLGPAYDKVPRFITKNGLKFKVNLEILTIRVNQEGLKLQCLDLIYVIILMLMCG